MLSENIFYYYRVTYCYMVHDISLFRELKTDIETTKRHIEIIKALLREQPVGIIKIAHETGLPEHKIRYSLRVLEKEHLIEPSREGAILTTEFMENNDQIAEEAREISEQLSEIYHSLKTTLIKR